MPSHGQDKEVFADFPGNDEAGVRGEEIATRKAFKTRIKCQQEGDLFKNFGKTLGDSAQSIL